MRQILRAGLLVLATLSLSSCAENVVTEPSANDSFFPVSQGDWQVVNRAKRNSSNQVVSTVRDSVYFQSNITIDAKNAMMVVSNIEGMTSDTNYIANSGTGAYRHMVPTTFGSLSPVSFGDRWIKIGEFGPQMSWTTFDTTIADVPFQAGPYSLLGSGKIVQVYEKKAERKIQLAPGDSVMALEIIATTAFDLTLTSTQTGDIPVKFNNVERLFFTKGKGLVRHYQDSYKVNAGPLTAEINGFDHIQISNYAK
jgi:hypothetical protein